MKPIIIFSVLMFTCTISKAQDRVFARTYQSNVLSKGSLDIEYWTTLRTGKVGANSDYTFGRYLDSRIEFEFGLGRNIQTAFYFNSSNFKYALIDTSKTELSTETKIETSFSNEWKFKLSDPVANSIGSALYLELGVGADEYEVEGKIILDKRINKNLFAMNIVCELELETELKKEGEKIGREMEWESPVEIDLAYMHFFKPTFGLGLEVRSMNSIAKEKGWENSVIFAGPSLFFSQSRFFGVLNLLPQITNLHKTKYAPGSMVHDDMEDYEFRLIIGYSF